MTLAHWHTKISGDRGFLLCVGSVLLRENRGKIMGQFCEEYHGNMNGNIRFIPTLVLVNVTGRWNMKGKPTI
jgi:hypothetical protein